MVNPIFEKQILQELKNLNNAYTALASYVELLGHNVNRLVEHLNEEEEDLPLGTDLGTDLGDKGLDTDEQNLG